MRKKFAKNRKRKRGRENQIFYGARAREWVSETEEPIKFKNEQKHIQIYAVCAFEVINAFIWLQLRRPSPRHTLICPFRFQKEMNGGRMHEAKNPDTYLPYCRTLGMFVSYLSIPFRNMFLRFRRFMAILLAWPFRMLFVEKSKMANGGGCARAKGKTERLFWEQKLFYLFIWGRHN